MLVSSENESQWSKFSNTSLRSVVNLARELTFTVPEKQCRGLFIKLLSTIDSLSPWSIYSLPS